MKVEVKQVFRDKITGQLYQAGAVVDFDDEQRVTDMVARGLAEVVGNDQGDKIKLFETEFERSAVVGALKVAGVKGNVQAMKPDTLATKVAELDAEHLSVFKQALSQQ